MTTNASTWFYTEPEHRAYLIEERVNQSLWANRINGAQLKCIQAEPPFRMTGTWNDLPITLEWVPNEYVILTAESEHPRIDSLLIGLKEVLGFVPTISYVTPENAFVAEWRRAADAPHIESIARNPKYRNIKRYK